LTISERFKRDGFAVIPGVFDPSEIKTLCEEADRMYAMSAAEREAVGDRVRWLTTNPIEGAKLFRGLQNTSRISPVFRRLQNDERLFAILREELGEHIKSPVDTLFWKPPGEANTFVAYHQDCAFRQPRENFRNLDKSYIQLGIALDPHGPENGGMRLIPGSHKKGDLEIHRVTSVLLEGPDASYLTKLGLEDLQEIDLCLAIGDVVVWSPFLLHGSPANPSQTLNRRFYVSAYMRAGDCDVGDRVFQEPGVDAVNAFGG
jgi:ectoine hydroxylase-related dioxygenase (phytanoyl-CoA dioxygenase family)